MNFFSIFHVHHRLGEIKYSSVIIAYRLAIYNQYLFLTPTTLWMVLSPCREEHRLRTFWDRMKRGAFEPWR
jgi:hypothetical protein